MIFCVFGVVRGLVITLFKGVGGGGVVRGGRRFPQFVLSGPAKSSIFRKGSRDRLTGDVYGCVLSGSSGTSSRG